jgi:hypothetical protein
MNDTLPFVNDFESDIGLECNFVSFAVHLFDHIATGTSFSLLLLIYDNRDCRIQSLGCTVISLCDLKVLKK